jgi:chaperonin GroES
MKLTPLGPRLVVVPIESDSVEVKQLEKSGLVLPEKYADKYKPRPSTGTVVAVSEDPVTSALVRVGDIVLFALHSGTPITVQGQDLIILEDRDILGKLEEEHADAEKAN